jgi:hypothetical protein
MQTPPRERADRYREHADKLRDIAKDVANPKTRAMLETMARDWEDMADLALRQDMSAADAKHDRADKRSG